MQSRRTELLQAGKGDGIDRRGQKYRIQRQLKRHLVKEQSSEAGLKESKSKTGAIGRGLV